MTGRPSSGDRRQPGGQTAARIVSSTGGVVSLIDSSTGF
jgi:hypothetical protein